MGQQKKKFMYLAISWQIKGGDGLASTLDTGHSGSGIPLECTPH